MNKLFALGYFREFGSRHSSNESIRDFIAAQPAPHQAMVVRYLREADEIAAEMELLSDVIDGSPQPDPASPHSDGRWVWRGDLAHYVERHNLRLPQEFVDRVVHAGGSPSSLPPDEQTAVFVEWYGLDPAEFGPISEAESTGND